jgi:hypothetical protein
MDRRRLLALLGAGGLAGCLGGGGTGSGDGTGGGDGAGDGDDSSGGGDGETTGAVTPTAGTANADGSGAATTAGEGSGEGSSTGGDSTGEGSTGESGTTTGTQTPTATPELGAVADHPAATGIRDQPRKGSFGGHVILTFEDPSCVRCAAFEKNTAPKIESKLVDTGKAAFVFRNYPVVYPWGEPATQALEATYARDEDAVWELADHYFTTRGQFSMDNVYSRTQSFLDSETDLDAEAVVDDARNEAYDDAVQADIDAAEAAELGATTPIVVLFRDGEFATTATGSVSYTLIANALGEA